MKITKEQEQKIRMESIEYVNPRWEMLKKLIESGVGLQSAEKEMSKVFDDAGWFIEKYTEVCLDRRN
jgi:hypothetical protein